MFKLFRCLFIVILPVLIALPGCWHRWQQQQLPQSEEAYDYALPSGYGKISKVNGLPRTKPISGYWRRTSSGPRYVKPYYRSR